jgi:hypothetical protein
MLGGSIGALGTTLALQSRQGEILASVQEAKQNRIYGAENIKRYIERTRRPVHRRNQGVFDSRINRRTGQPHFHQREIVRRTTKPGTPERRAGMEAIRRVAV